MKTYKVTIKAVETNEFNKKISLGSTFKTRIVVSID